VELTEEQVEAAEAHGCAFLPASGEQVARLSMQRRVFTVAGRPFVATRDGGGFLETHATLARLIEPGGRGATGGGRETVRQAEAADAASAREIDGERGAGEGAEVRRPRASARRRSPWRGEARGGG
jgi:hypothetical protein